MEGIREQFRLCCLEGHQRFPCFIAHPADSDEEGSFRLYLQSGSLVPGAAGEPARKYCDLCPLAGDREWNRRDISAGCGPS